MSISDLQSVSDPTGAPVPEPSKVRITPISGPSPSDPVRAPVDNTEAAEEKPQAPLRQSAVRDSLIVTLGGQLERAFGTITAMALKWGLDPTQHGIYTGLRLVLDHANRSNLGIGRGAVQQVPILRASGQCDEAERITNVAFTACSLAALLYAVLAAAAAVAGWWWFRSSADAQALAWSGGLAMVSGLVVLKRYQDFLIAIHRAHQRFALTTELAVIDSILLAILVVLGLWLAGLWGLWLAIGLLYLFNAIYLHGRHRLRFQWAWDGRVVVRLFQSGWPIMFNGAVFGALLALDRVLILTFVPNGTRAAGLYTIALMGTSWGLDLAGRIASVMYTYFQSTLGRSRDPKAVAEQAARVIEAQGPPLAFGCAIAYVVGPEFLGLLVPRYEAGAQAIRPLLPGVLLLGLAMPNREALITVGRPIPLALRTGLGLILTALAGVVGAVRFGLIGVAWSMTLGFSAVYFLSSAAALSQALGVRRWLIHQAKVAGSLAWFVAGAGLMVHGPIAEFAEQKALVKIPLSSTMLVVWCLPALVVWGHRHGWGGLKGTAMWPQRSLS